MFAEGLYSGLRVGQGLGESKDKKTPYVYVEFEIRHIAVNGNWRPVPSPEKRTVMMYLTDGAWPSTCQKLDSLGFKGDLKNPQFDEATANQGVELRCRHEPYTNPNTGKTRTNEKWELEGWGEQSHSPISDLSKLDVFAARYRQEKANTGAPPPPMAGAPAGQQVRTAVGTFPTNQPGSPPAAGAVPPATTSTPPAASGGPGSPPPMGGPPPIGGPTPAPVQRRTREEAWRNAVKAHADAPPDVMAMEWQKAIAEVRPGKAEAALTPEDWYAIECRLVAPF